MTGPVPHSAASTAASERQVEAAHPRASTWLSANAGSGKTRVLTDRVARLLLRGVEPQHILCLTYTKAAASEMQNRLFKRLGEWAMKPDADLRAALAELGEGADLDAGRVARARQLFARAIETPGGLRIQTIHSFCATLLRRFPLEAGVSPRFTELDERAAKLLREDIVQEMADSLHPGLMADLAAAWTGEDFSKLMEQVVANRHDFATPLDEVTCRSLFGLTAGDGQDRLLSDVFLGDEAAWIPDVIACMAKGKVTDVKQAAILERSDFTQPSMALLRAMEQLFLFGEDTKAPFTAKIGSLPTAATRDAMGPALLERLNNLMDRVEQGRLTRIALKAAEKAVMLHRFAAAFLPLYEDRKAARGWLDFDDLISRARRVLTDPSVAAWVLFRLDGGIDHILVDEAQDTSPDQWQVIESLAAEFTTGQSARDVERTLFVVGDKKQSIYSFQGADVAAFDGKHHQFESRFRAVSRPFQTLQLEYSFRSSPAVLRVVDDTFGDRFRPAMGGAVSHIAFYDALPGRVDLWPLIEPAKDKDEDDWENPVDHVADSHHNARLAEMIASEIDSLLRGGLVIPTEHGNRPAHAGDFLILVQRRSALFAEIIRACKAKGLPIAGADRLKLGAELAVRDLTALLSFLATDQDDLSLAAVLRSPLFGLTEAELYALTRGRTGPLWREIRNNEGHAATWAVLRDLRDQVDFLRPYELLERILTRHGGRQRLIARLGEEAEDGIDALLAQALAYERLDLPSLTGFLCWLETDEVTIKRQMDSEGRRIRVMTVHGAKGLEAPIVILPETVDRKPPDHDEVAFVAGHPVWKVPKPERPAAMAAALAERDQRAEEENLRLLYVAMTRARVWLIICGAGEAKKNQAWYRLAEQGLQAAGAVPIAGGRRRHACGTWPDPNPVPAEAAPGRMPLPDWASRPAPDAPRELPPLSPSDLGGAKALPGDGLDEELAKARGTALHALLEYLPGVPVPDRPALAAALVPEVSLRADVLAEAGAVLADPALAFLFGPETLAEVPITARFGPRCLLGTIDRLIITPDRVLAVDYKTNRVVPSRPEDTPEGLLRQLGAYAHALAALYPHHRIETAILWTRTRQLMPYPAEIVGAALARTTIP